MKITGKEFKERILSNLTPVKFLSKSEKKEMKYDDTFSFLEFPWRLNEKCFHVNIEDEASVERISGSTFTADKFTLGKEVKLTPDILLEAVKLDPFNLKYANYQTEEMCETALLRDRNTIMYAFYQPERLCLEILKKDGCLIQFIKEPTKEMYVEAVKQNKRALYLIRKDIRDEIHVLYISSKIKDDRNIYDYFTESTF